jgi:Zn-dependent protease with chaperone function
MKDEVSLFPRWRALGDLLILVIGYFLVMALTLVTPWIAIILLEGKGVISKEIAMILTVGFALFASFCGFLFNFALGPLQLRRLLEPKTSEKLSTEMREKIEKLGEVFQIQGVRRPQIFITSAHQGDLALISGFGFGRGIFQPGLFLGETLFEKLSEDEVEAVVAHEASHLYHGHLLKRAGLGFTVFVSSMFLCGIFLVIQHYPEPPRYPALLLLSFFLLVPGVITASFLKLQTIAAEFEADQTAVLKFGASALSLISALRKLEESSGLPPQELTRTRILALQTLRPKPQELKRAA